MLLTKSEIMTTSDVNGLTVSDTEKAVAVNINRTP